MTLDRTIAGIFLLLCVVYGYTAFVPMEANLLPFERYMAFLPNTMPKWLSVLGAIVAIAVIVTTGPKNQVEVKEGDIDYRNLLQYKLGQALGLVGIMVAYALLLRWLGFIAATTLFLGGGSIVLGERKYVRVIAISVVAAFSVWYLVQELLGIFLKPWPWFI